MSIKNPKTKADWGAIANKNKELSAQMKKDHFTYVEMDDLNFKNSLEGQTQERLKVMIVKMKGEMLFYKKIMQEAYYVEHPEKKKTQRFKEAMRKYKSINSKGKIIHSLINT